MSMRLRLSAAPLLIVLLFQGCPDTDVGPHELVPCATLLSMRSIGEESQGLEREPSPFGGIKSMISYDHYTEIARRAFVEGWVTVRFAVNEEGRARDAQVVKGLGAGLDEQANLFILEGRYVPAVRDGVATQVSAEAIVRFNLECVAE